MKEWLLIHSSNWGLAMDHIVAADVVLADGSLVHASASENSEVYWALRGAAESFGIITTFYLQTHPAPESVTYFSFPFGEAMYQDKETFTNSFLHIQDFAKNESVIDSRISWGTYMDGTTYSLSGTFFGSVEEFESTVQPEFLRGIIQPPSITVQSYNWTAYLILMGGADTITVPTTGYDEHDNFFAKSITVPEADGGLTADAIGAFYDYVTAGSPPDGYYIIINLYGGPGSQINAKDTEFAAYSERDSLWVFQNYGMQASSIDYIQGLNDAIINAQPQTKFGAYLNYVDPSYDAATAHELYYGEELYSKLLPLKQKFDPQSVFWNPQAIGA